MLLRSHSIYWHHYQHSFLSSIKIHIYSPTFVLLPVAAEIPYARELPGERKRICVCVCVCECKMNHKYG